jgi:hypothetical protein
MDSDMACNEDCEREDCGIFCRITECGWSDAERSRCGWSDDNGTDSEADNAGVVSEAIQM